MAVDTQAIINLVVIVSGDCSVNRNVKEAGKAAAAIGVGAFLGGLCAGPRGMLAGGLLSSAATYFMKQDDFVSLKEAIQNMPTRKQEMIAREMKSFISKLEIRDVAILTAMCLEAMQSGGIRELVRDPILNSLRENAFRVVSNHMI